MPPRAAAAARQRARLPQHVERALNQLPAAAERLTGRTQPELSSAQHAKLAEALGVLREYLQHPEEFTDITNIVSGRDDVVVALVQLCAVGARCAVPAVADARYEKLELVVDPVMGIIPMVIKAGTVPSADDAAIRSVEALARLIVQTQFPQAASRQAAQAIVLLRGAEGAAAGAAEIGLLGRVCATALRTCRTVEALTGYAEARKDKALAASLHQALRESSLLEHVGRLLLLVGASSSGVAPSLAWSMLAGWQAEAVVAWSQITNRIALALSKLIGINEAGTGRALLGSDTCHALLMIGAAALASADGGPCGLPRSPLLKAPQANNPRAAYPCIEALTVNRLMVGLAQELVAPQPSVPPRAAIRLMLRALRLAAASMAAAGGRVGRAPGGTLRVELSWAGGRRAEAQEYRLLLQREGAGWNADQAFQVLLHCAERWPEAWGAEAGAAFVPLLSALRHYLASSATGLPLVAHVAALLPRLTQPLVGLAGKWNQPLPAPVTAVLSCGLLPALEALLRCAAADPHGPEARIAEGFMAFTDPALPSLLELLRRSPPRQAAAFMSTLAKLLRRTPAAALLEPLPQTPSEQRCRHLLPVFAVRLLGTAAQELEVLRGRSDPAGPPDPLAPNACSFVAGAAVLWLLPEVSRLAREAVELQRTRSMPLSGQALDAARAVLSVTGVALEHALKCGGIRGEHARRTAAEDAPPCPSRRLAAACCVPFVVGEGGAVPFIGALLELVDTPRGRLGLDDEFLAQLTGCFSMVAFPPHLISGTPASAAGAGTGEGCASAGPNVGAPAPFWRPSAMRQVVSLVAGCTPRHRECALVFVGTVERLQRGEAEPVDPKWTDLFERQAQALAALRAEVRGVLPTCSNPACVSLAGDSEAGVELLRCSKCRQLSYCCRDCQAAHWKAGHKAACVAKQG